jgi:3-(3-hydroxy-phenyl)propionate hydroxylase
MQLLASFRPYDETMITRATVYTFHARIAERMQQQRILLLGDAAHLTPPFAGQGLNAGIRDAHNAAWKIAAVVQGIAAPQLLQSYEAERRAPIWAMIQLAVALGEFVMPRGDKQLALKNSLMETLERFPEARDYLFQMRFKPKPRYRQGIFIDLDNQLFEAALVGEMIPQPRVVDERGNEYLLDDILGPGFALIVQDDAGERCLAGLDQPVWQQLKPGFVRLYPAGRSFAGGPFRRAGLSDNIIGRPLLTHRDQILLIRPDRYVLGAFFPDQAAAFSARLQTLLNCYVDQPASGNLFAG